MTAAMIFLLGVGGAALLSITALLITRLATAPVPLTAPSLVPIWVLAVVFGLLSLRLVYLAWRRTTRGPFLRIDDRGVANLKDGVGPIPWPEILGAAVRSGGSVGRLGGKWTLFVEVSDQTADRVLANASPLVRPLVRGRPTGGTVELPIIGYPPYSLAKLESTLEEIRSRASGTRPSSPA